MKIRAQTKKVKGKLRWYLAASYRDDAGKPRTKWLLYLGDPPSPKLKKIIAYCNQHPLFWVFAFFNIKEDIITARKNRKRQRSQRIAKLKRRRDLYAAMKGCPVPKNAKDSVSQFRREIWVIEQKLKLLEADPHLGPIEAWPEHQKQILRRKLAPLFETISQVVALLSAKEHSKTIQPTVDFACAPDDQTTEEKSDELMRMLKVLDEREATIIRGRFGLDDGTITTLAELGRKFSVTRERVRQIQKIALRELRRVET